MARRNFYIKESEMDDFQRRLINKRLDGDFIVEGCAGSGKSVIAFWKLHDIVMNKRGTAQVVVYTKALKNYFVAGCRDEGIDPELVDYWNHWENNPRTTDYLIVDEAQDFSEKDILMFQGHANVALLLFGDSSQQIYQFLARLGKSKRVTMEEIRDITGFKYDRLVFNHRLPARIARVAQYLNTEGDDLEDRCTDEGVENPYFLQCKSFEEQLYKIAEIVRNRDLEDVGVLLPNNDKVKEVADFLRSKGISVEAKFSGPKSGHNTLNFATTNLKVMTYHSAKGLQFKAVFLPGCEHSEMSGFLEPLYVAMTRPYELLYVLYSDGLPRELANIPAELYSSSTQSEETEYL